jgi:hypothetical protein
MWWVQLGTFWLTNRANFELFAHAPRSPRIKNNAKLRERRLRELIAASVEAEDYLRAHLLKTKLAPAQVAA